MKVPQGFAWSKGSQGSVSNKMFLAKKKAKENILGSHPSESKLTHIRIMCSPHMLLLLFFHVSCIVVYRCHNKTTTTFLATATNLKSVLILEKMVCLSVSPI